MASRAAGWHWSAAALALVVGWSAAAEPGNRPERVEWFRDLGFGMFIHWSVDSQLGSVISHSLVGASEDYVDRYFRDLPQTFLPTDFAPADWARLARVAGMKYVMFTAKHHNGFCMFDTATTEFGVMRTPFARDVTREVVEAFRNAGIAVGIYFSPDDFWFLHQQGLQISRSLPHAMPSNNPDLMAHNRAQLRELLTHYGPIDLLFLDGEPEGLRELAWELQPDIVITRGGMETPEQEIPGQPLEGPWEACFTMGTQWQFKPTNETYKTGTALIEMLIETRAKGGNLLLNVGPTPDGDIPFEQDRLLREMALWSFVNGEAVYAVRPWRVTHHGNVWYTKAKDGGALYAFVTGEPWPYAEERHVALPGLRATDDTRIEILGQSGLEVEYRPQLDPKTTWQQTDAGLDVRAMRAQRLYNDKTWPNPVVLRIAGAGILDNAD